MDAQKPVDSTPILLRLYRLLLRAYPARFQEVYACQMQQLLADVYREAKWKGRTSDLVRVWGITLVDLICTIPAEHFDGLRPSLNLRGPVLMLGGALFSVGFLLSNAAPTASPSPVGTLCLAVSSLLITIGLIGFQASYAYRLGFAGRGFLLLAALGSSISLAGGLGLAFTGLDLFWGARMFGFVMLFLFMALFGLVCLLRRPLPRFNGVPFLIGIWIPAGGLFGALYHAATGAWLGDGSLATVGILMTISLGFLLMGDVLRTDPVRQYPLSPP